MLRLYHNKRCSKSRECLELIINSNIKFKLINYLEDDISSKDLENLIEGLIDPLEDLIRKNETFVKGEKKLILVIKKI